MQIPTRRACSQLPFYALSEVRESTGLFPLRLGGFARETSFNSLDGRARAKLRTYPTFQPSPSENPRCVLPVSFRSFLVC